MAKATIKRKGRGVKKSSVVETSKALPIGAHFTIAGCGIGQRGQVVWDGRSIDTRRKAKCVTLTLYRVTDKEVA